MSDSLDDYLSRLEPAFTTACESILRSPAPVDTAYGLFWFQVGGTVWNRLPIALVWCDHEHGCDVQYPSPLTSFSSPEWSPPSGVDNSTIGARIFHWIFRCWNKADGATSTIPFYCHNYQTLEQFCLRRARYVTDQDISADIGAKD